MGGSCFPEPRGTKDPAWRRCIWLKYFSIHQDYLAPPRGRLLTKNPGSVLPRPAEEPGCRDGTGGQNLTLSCVPGSSGPEGSHNTPEADSGIFTCFVQRKTQETLSALGSLLASSERRPVAESVEVERNHSDMRCWG